MVKAVETLARVTCLDHHEQAKPSPRAQEADRLIRHGRKAYSQNDEDSVIAEIFAQTGTGWRGLTFRPRVVVIEYNATIRPPVAVTTSYDQGHVWDASSYFSASPSALKKLGREKGYALVGCCHSGANTFFVHDDLVSDRFCAPFTDESQLEPPRCFLRYPTENFPGVGLNREV